MHVKESACYLSIECIPLKKVDILVLMYYLALSSILYMILDSSFERVKLALLGP